jgi:hypothetical protein
VTPGGSLAPANCGWVRGRSAAGAACRGRRTAAREGAGRPRGRRAGAGELRLGRGVVVRSGRGDPRRLVGAGELRLGKGMVPPGAAMSANAPAGLLSLAIRDKGAPDRLAVGRRGRACAVRSATRSSRSHSTKPGFGQGIGRKLSSGRYSTTTPSPAAPPHRPSTHGGPGSRSPTQPAVPPSPPGRRVPAVRCPRAAPAASSQRRSRSSSRAPAVATTMMAATRRGVGAIS